MITREELVKLVLASTKALREQEGVDGDLQTDEECEKEFLEGMNEDPVAGAAVDAIAAAIWNHGFAAGFDAVHTGG